MRFGPFSPIVSILPTHNAMVPIMTIKVIFKAGYDRQLVLFIRGVRIGQVLRILRDFSAGGNDLMVPVVPLVAMLGAVPAYGCDDNDCTIEPSNDGETAWVEWGDTAHRITLDGSTAPITFRRDSTSYSDWSCVSKEAWREGRNGVFHRVG